METTRDILDRVERPNFDTSIRIGWYLIRHGKSIGKDFVDFIQEQQNIVQRPDFQEYRETNPIHKLYETAKEKREFFILVVNSFL